MITIMAFILAVILAVIPAALSGYILSSLGLGISYMQAFGICVAFQMLQALSPKGASGSPNIYVVDKETLKEFK